MNRRLATCILVGALLVPAIAPAKISKQLKEEVATHVQKMAEETDDSTVEALLLVRAMSDPKASKEALVAGQGSEIKRIKIAANIGLYLSGDKKALGTLTQELMSDARLLETLDELVAALPAKTQTNILEDLWKAATPDIKPTILRFAVNTNGAPSKFAEEILKGKSAPDRKLAVAAYVAKPTKTSVSTISTLTKSKDEAARLDAYQGLVALSRHPELEPSTREFLLAGLKDQNAQIKTQTTRRVLELKLPEGVSAAFTLMKTLEEPAARIEWMNAILQTGLRTKLEDANAYLKAEDAEEKALGHELAAASRDPEFIKELLKMETSTEFEPRKLALRSLGRTNSPEALKVYQRTIFEALDEVRKATVEGLSQLGMVGGLDVLEKALRNERNPEIKLAVIDAIGQIKDPKSVQALRFLVTDSNPKIKLAALKGIRNIGLKEGGAALDVLLRDRNVEIQWLAYLTALELAPEKAEKAQEQAFRNPPATYMDDIRALKTPIRNKLIGHLLAKTTGSAQSDAIRWAINFGGFDKELRDIALDSTGATGDRKAIFFYFQGSSDRANEIVLEKVVRANAGPKQLVQSTAWLLARNQDKDMEPTFRGFLAASNPTVKAIALYGINAIHY